MYLIEGPEAGFTSIPRGVYWGVVTLTTVGYGDIAPVTAVGQALAAMVMIMGYGIIAVPTGIVSAEYSRMDEYVHVNSYACPNCNAATHRDDSKFCYRCGDELHPDEF
jgi:voltage-gated potassium channel